VTASRPRESSEIPPISKRISLSAFNRSTQSCLSDVRPIDSSPCDELKNPRAALTLPGGDLMVAIVKHDQYPNSTQTASSLSTMAHMGKTTDGFCPACPQMIITNGQQQSLLCWYISITIYW
jgi:hypothetical protein